MRALVFVHIVSTLVLVSCQTHNFSPQQFSCIASESPVPNATNLPDFLKIGDTLFSIKNLQPFRDNDGDKKFVEILGDNVTLKYDLTQICNTDMELRLTCSDGVEKNMLVRTDIERTQEYNISMNAVYTTTVQEMTPNGTKLNLNEKINVHFSDCGQGTYFQETDMTPNITLQNDGGGHFRWQASGNFDTLLVNDLIDYEKNQSFALKLQVEYKALKAMATTEILVNVTDIDDNNPVFNLSGVDGHYQLNIKEGNATALNTPLSSKPTIHAYDPDFGINQPVKYSITEQPESGLFDINSDNGSLSITKALDRETKASYRLVIQAEQTDSPSRAASAVVQVTVEDIDDNLPEFNPINVTVDITEHSMAGTFIHMLSVSDPDEGDNSNFTCVLFNTSLPVTVTTVIGGCDVTVKESTSFDREAFTNGEIIAQIGAKATLKGIYGPENATMTIRLQDINDNTPQFTETGYSFTLSNITAGSKIGKINATDPDYDGNGNVTYRVLAPVSEDCIGGSSHSDLPFNINIISGEVFKSASAPMCKVYRTMVEACDNPAQVSTRRCSTVPMVISTNSTEDVQNVSQKMSVSENIPLDSYVDTLQCRGNGYSYQVPTGSGFTVQNGFVKTASALDREQTDMYSFEIEVKNKDAQVVCHVNVTIYVTDVNDNAPVFTNKSFTFNFPENAVDGQSIGYISAIDADQDGNGIVDYLLYNQDDPDFMINKSSGEISIKSVAKITPCDVITLSAMARDQGIPALKALTQVRIVCHHSDTSIPISVPLNKEEVESMKDTLESKISEILNISITISVINRVARSVPEKTQILIKTTDPTIQQSKLLQAVVHHYEEIRALFYNSHEEEREPDTSDSTFGAPEIALIAMGGVIIIGTVVAIVIINRQFNSQKRYKQLYESLTKNSSLYESQEIKVKMDDETSDYNGSVRSQDLASNGSIRSPALTVSAVNPGYLHDDETHLKQTSVDEITVIPTDDTTNNTVKEVIESLERLSDRLEHEDENTVVASFNTERIESGDEIPLVDKDTEADGDYENLSIVSSLCKNDTNGADDDHGKSSPVLYANVTMRNDVEAKDEDEFPVASNKARNSLEIPRLDGISSNSLNVEAEINHTDQNSVEDTERVTLDDDEPNPDYEVKQVRFSGEVLDADDNVLQPLKPDKDVTGGKTDDDKVGNEQNSEAEDIKPPSDDQFEPGWVEEEIQSPVNTVVESETGEEFFFCDDALTHL